MSSAPTKTAPAAPSFRAGFERAFENPWLAYPALLLLQLKAVWGMWQERDLTTGDTSSYFAGAWLWYQNWASNICWSPLYTAFYGSFLHLSEDAYFATIAHRLVMVFAISLLVLVWMRRMLPPAIAWLAAAWWAILPINFDALYEVHLFTVLPVLAAGLVLVSFHGSWARGVSLAILVLTSFLVRNEQFVTTAVLASFILVAEVREIARDRRPRARRVLARLGAYGLPLLAVAALVSFFYARSSVKFPEIRDVLSSKHTLNVCQIYAFGYMQRRTDWKGSPWTQCHELMQRDFGATGLTLSEALRRNRKAILEHLWWNASLIPSGLQVLLFNATSGSVNPDYVAVRMRSLRALALGLLLCGLFGAGAVALWRERTFWWSWIRERVRGWLYLVAVDCTLLIVAVTQRPRPSYLFPLGLSVMTAAGMALFALVRHRGERLVPAAATVGALLLIVLTPTYTPMYQGGRAEGDTSRPLLKLYRRLEPFAELFHQPSVRFVSPHYPHELCRYLERRVDRYCQGVTPQSLVARTPGSAYDGVDVVLVDETHPASRDSAAPLLRDPATWRVVARGGENGRGWMLLARRKPGE